jgi:Rod binding domain-containing protein
VTTIGKSASFMAGGPLGLGGAATSASLPEPVIPQAPTLAKGAALDAKKRAEVKEVANEFEALFFNLVLKSMRDTVQKGGLIDGGNAESIYKSMLDDEYAKMMAAQRTTGLGDNVERYLLEAMGVAPAEARTAAPEADAAAADAPPPKAVARLEAALDGLTAGTAPGASAKALGLKAYKDQTPGGPLLGPALPATMDVGVSPQLQPSSSVPIPSSSSRSPKSL